MQTKIDIICDNDIKTVTCKFRACLLDVIKAAGIRFDAPCGGNHTCLKCKIIIVDGTFSPITSEERNSLSREEIEKGVRLACLTYVIEGGTVRIPSGTRANIRELGLLRDVECSPAVKRKYLELPIPNVGDQRDDLLRIQEELKMPVRFSYDALKKLPQVLSDTKYKLTAVIYQDTVIKILPFDQEKKYFGVAIDIGTTTIVGYLIDLTLGVIVNTYSELNAQKIYGADVISRIQYTIDHEDGLSILSNTLISQLDNIILTLAKRTKINTESIDCITLAGNTILSHFLLNVSPKSIASAPFEPVFTQMQNLEAKTLGLASFIGQAFILPCVSGYIGSDITAGLVACDIQKDQKRKLLIDLGTNGEMVLGNSEFLLGCSTAAGPAFEGAEIYCGMGGIDGAINSFSMEDGRINYTTIGDKHPIGICGSGLIDIMAALIENNIVDETGRMLSKDEIEGPYRDYACEADGEPAFIVAGDREPIVITQKDVRRLQLAKAAVAAGIQTLVDHIGKTLSDIDAIYLAGGFGSFINKESAAKIGLLPKKIEDRIQVVGNAAGMGAILALKSEAAFNQMKETAQKTQYIELSCNPKFQDFYMDCMFF